MKILALDIGAGTEDILLYDDEKKNIENCVKMILPSPSQVYAEKVREATHQGRDLYIKGDIIGGGAFAWALRDHIKQGLRVSMTKNSAYTIRNGLDEVRKMGIEVVQNGFLEKPRAEILVIEEVNIEKLKTFLAAFHEDLSNIDVVAVAVQDHGVFPKGTSNRKLRIQKLRELLESDPRPESLAFLENEVPSCFLRMKSAIQASRRQLPRAEVLVMDTAPAAILGSTRDRTSKAYSRFLAINIGNGHTMAAVIYKGKVAAVMEHHTHLLNPERIERLLVDFADGNLTDEEVFDDGGHGLLFLEPPLGFSQIEKIVATGPNRNLLTETNLQVHFAAPGGDVMMTGPIGLVEATKTKKRDTSRKRGAQGENAGLDAQSWRRSIGRI